MSVLWNTITFIFIFVTSQGLKDLQSLKLTYRIENIKITRQLALYMYHSLQKQKTINTLNKNSPFQKTVNTLNKIWPFQKTVNTNKICKY